MNLAVTTEFSPEDNIPPVRFIEKQDGIYYEVQKQNDDLLEVWLCSPLRVDALVRDGSGHGWSRRVIVTDPEGRTHECVVTNASLANSKNLVLKQLSHLGLELAPGNAARNTLIELLQAWKPHTTLTSTARLGWTDDSCAAFVLGNGRIIGEQSFIFMNTGADTIAANVKSAGTLAEWKAEVGARCADNPLLVAGVSLALSGPLLELLEADGGGLHLRGKSSRGKSTILRAAVSVWGHPDLLQTWRATANGLEGVAAACNGTLLALDELGLISPRDAFEAAYMLADGRGKSRADATGKAKPILTWRLPILSSGEISLAAKIAEGGRTAMAGQNVRLLDIVADGRCNGAFDELHGAVNGAAFSNQMKEATANAYGTAGPRFAEVLQRYSRKQLVDDCRMQMENFQKEAEKKYELTTDGQIARAVSRFGLIALAGELATRANITGWDKHSATQAALILLGEWLEGRDHNEPDEIHATVDRTERFLSINSGRFKLFDGEPLKDQAGYQDNEMFYVSPDIWRNIHRGHSAEKAAQHLESSGFLMRGDNKNLARKLPRAANPDRPRHYCVRKSIIGIGVTSSERSDQSDIFEKQLFAGALGNHA
jgi:putative DNA primase/helicase